MDRNFFVPNRGQFLAGNQGPLNSGFPPANHVDRGGQWAPVSQAAYSNPGVPTSTQGDGRGQVIYPDFLVSGRNDFVLDPAVAAAPSYHAELYNAQQGRPPSQLTEAIYSRNPQDPNGFGERGSAQIDHNGHPQGLDPRYLDRLRLEASRCQELGVKCRDLEQGNQELKAQMHDLKQDHKKKFETLERWMNDQVTEIRGYLATIVGKVEHGDALLQTTKNEVQGMLKETIQRWEAQAAEESAATKGT